jgi:predicted TIM-barrel fold metal-dependent hydrolase
MHAGGVNGLPVTSSGWPSYYLEEHQDQSLTVQSALISLLFSGVFETFPDLRILSIEAGFGFVPGLIWRLDKIWERNRAELPQVKRPPSEYLKRNVWFATQPTEEPEKIGHMLDLLEWIGWDRLVFASDYPHWDFDDPRYAFKVKMTPEQLANILSGNARKIYRF